MAIFNGNKATSCGKLGGHIRGTNSWIKLGTISLELDLNTAHALCNVLCPEDINKNHDLGEAHRKSLIKLGAAIAAFCDHSNADMKEP